MSQESKNNEINTYLKSIAVYPLLTKEEEVELSKRIQNNDLEARDKLINHNLKLVVSIASEYYLPNVSLMDLIQQGNLGLIKAANKYDYNFNTRFSTYATPWIKDSIYRYIENSNNVKLPSNIQLSIRRIKSIKSKLTQELGHSPKDEDIIKEYKSKFNEEIDIQELHLYYSFIGQSISLDATTQEFDPLSNVIQSNDTKPTEYAYNTLLKEEIQKCLQILNPRERLIIELRYGLNNKEEYSLQKIGDMLGVSRERIRQLEKLALFKMSQQKEFLKSM